MRRPRLTIAESGQKVPGYIVTFSDMVTLLLTFFVMLLTLADVQDPELFNKGRDAFVKSIKFVGLGALFGRQEMPDFGSFKPKYSIPESDDSLSHRTIDARTQKLRTIFQELKQLMITVPSQIVAKRTNYSVANVHFSPGSADLNESAKKYLTEFCRDLQQNPSQNAIELYVLGLASDVNTEREQWLLSANRAQAVANFLRNTLSAESAFRTRSSIFGDRPKWSVYSWGAGPGGDWVGQDSPISEKSQILIAVLRARD